MVLPSFKEKTTIATFLNKITCNAIVHHANKTTITAVQTTGASPIATGTPLYPAAAGNATSPPR
jgi:hypothetical protein